MTKNNTVSWFTLYLLLTYSQCNILTLVVTSVTFKFKYNGNIIANASTQILNHANMLNIVVVFLWLCDSVVFWAIFRMENSQVSVGTNMFIDRKLDNFLLFFVPNESSKLSLKYLTSTGQSGIAYLHTVQPTWRGLSCQ